MYVWNTSDEILLTLINIFGLHIPLQFRRDGIGPVAHYDLGYGIGNGEGILMVVEVKEALIVVMVLLHLMVVVIGVLKYMCTV